MSYLSKYATRPVSTPQSQPIPGSSQVPNSGGGYSWVLDDWGRLERFLLLGSEGGTYYISEQKLTQDNAKVVERCIAQDGKRTVDTIVRVSHNGLAPKNDPALFALAMCASLGNDVTRKYALDNLQKVARIGTHLMHFAQFVEQFRGWGRGLRRAIGAWYQDKDLDALSYQLVKYQGRDGWTNRDLLRLAHPQTSDPARNFLYRWVVKGMEGVQGLNPGREFPVVYAFEQAKNVTDPKGIASLIQNYNLPREGVPSEFLAGDPKNAVVWEALLETGGLTMIIRNLATMTRAGILSERSNATRKVLSLMTGENLKKARVHPLQVLVALKTYAQGHGERGGNSWVPVQRIIDGLDSAFYESFQHVVPTGKAHLLALDVSASMTWHNIAGMPGITPRIGSAAMALVTAAVEPDYEIMGFSHRLEKIPVTPRMRLDDVIHKIEQVRMGGTNCALPMRYAIESQQRFDAFCVYTDNETNSGSQHPAQALREYRSKFVQDARLIVIGMEANPFTIADPNDPGMLDLIGFSPTAPAIIADFVR